MGIDSSAEDVVVGVGSLWYSVWTKHRERGQCTIIV